MTKSGMQMIREAADAASLAFNKHWLKRTMSSREWAIQHKLGAPFSRRMWSAAQAADIETIMEDLKK